MRPTRTLIVIANGAKARFFTHERPQRRLAALTEFAIDVPPGRDIMADRPGRSFSSVGPGRSSMEPRSDPRDLIEKDFARRVVDRMAASLAETGADRLVVAAAPRTLAEMRKGLTAQIEAKLAVSLDKDLTNTPEAELIKHLGDALGV
ncbi:MAG: hypothetical protein BroJett030_28450 [Alphaproteobacteria bacterium]|nr:MAG: hypothetical protein BroJett030_28450 [Alphaproteobacteria bacterium]